MLIIFGRGIDKDQKRCWVQVSQFLLSPVLISPKSSQVYLFFKVICYLYYSVDCFYNKLKLPVKQVATCTAGGEA